MMQFDKEDYSVEGLLLNGVPLIFRAFRNLVYVDTPIHRAYQSLHIFVPEALYHGTEINGYTLKTAPVFVPNTVGGYMPGALDEPGFNKHKFTELNSIYRALEHGYVVAAPAIRGRGQLDKDSLYIGKAPSCIVDYKAAIRYLRYFSDVLPGDQEKIITNGTSAGGCMSSLMGATGNHPDYAGYLEEIGAADSSDAVFAASCYCPITNLEHADTAYEWQFKGVYEYDGHFGRDKGTITAEQVRLSEELAHLFPDYLNSLCLIDEAGNPLTLDSDGNGSFKEHIKRILAESARAALGKGVNVFTSTWISGGEGAIAVDFEAWAKDIGRTKTPPAFDDIHAKDVENDLFGTPRVDACHFTQYIKERSESGAPMADGTIVKMMNPMNYLDDEAAVKAKHWRIRHGARDRDTSLSISVMLACALRQRGVPVDYHAPWGMPHAGDYDLDELFRWIDTICKE